MTTDSILAPIAAITLPDSGALTGSAQRAVDFIRGFVIAGAEDYGLAADELKSIKAKRTALEEKRTAITGPINRGLKAINDLFRGPGELLDEAERLLKGKMLAYDQEQARIAAEARRKAEEAAAIERKRLADEAAAREREAQAAAAAAAAAKAAGDAAAEQAAQAAAARANAEAQAAALNSQLVVAAPPAVEVVKVAGISTRTTIDFEVTSLAELVAHVAKHPELLGLLKVDETRLRAYVRGLGVACALPGVKVNENKVMSARAA